MAPRPLTPPTTRAANANANWSYAHLGRRVLALIFDSFLTLVFTFGMVVVSVPLLIGAGAQPSGGITVTVMLLVGFLPWVAYWYVPVALTGKTLGKKVLGIRIVRAADMRTTPGWGWALARSATSGLLGVIPFGIGQLANLLAAGVDDHSRALHDRTARTRVINEQHPPRHGVAIALAVIAVGLIINLILAAIAIPVFLNQRSKGVEAQMAQDAKAVSSHVMTEAEAGRIDADTFPITIPAGTTGTMIGAGAFTPAPGDSIAVTLIPGPDAYFCVRVDNPGAHAPLFLDSSDGSIDHTPCDGTAPTQVPNDTPTDTPTDAPSDIPDGQVSALARR